MGILGLVCSIDGPVWTPCRSGDGVLRDLHSGDTPRGRVVLSLLARADDPATASNKSD